MIAVLRVRFATNTDPSTVWPDQTFQNWLNPSIPYSLANYWWESGWGSFDLSSQLFPSMVMADPRSAVDVPNRQILVDTALAAATSGFNVDWKLFDSVLIWYAQRTDMFGGGSYIVKPREGGTKTVRVCVVDIGSPFDGQCQERGHAYGLNHEIDAGRNEYMDPYSVMSARGYAGGQPDFLRPTDARLSDGDPLLSPTDRFNQVPASRIIGPLLTPAHLLAFPWFETSPHVVTVSPTYRQSPVHVRVFALDVARDAHPAPMLTAMAVLWPGPSTGFTYTFELRRRGAKYEQGIGDGNPVEGVVMHAIGPDGRVRYEGVLPLSSSNGDQDWRNAIYTIRLGEVGPNNEWVEFSVMAGPFAQRRGVDLDPPAVQSRDNRDKPETVLLDEPCLAGIYTYERITTDHQWTTFARSYGFDDPAYRWYVNGTLLTESGQFEALPLVVEVIVPSPPTSAVGITTQTVRLNLDYRVSGNRLDVLLSGAPGNVTLTVRVVARSTASPDGVQVADERYVSAVSLRYEWDSAYKRKLAECFDWMNDVVDQEYPPVFVDPGDPVFHVAVDDIEEAVRLQRAISQLIADQDERVPEVVRYAGLRFHVSPRMIEDAQLGLRFGGLEVPPTLGTEELPT